MTGREDHDGLPDAMVQVVADTLHQVESPGGEAHDGISLDSQLDADLGMDSLTRAAC